MNEDCTEQTGLIGNTCYLAVCELHDIFHWNLVLKT